MKYYYYMALSKMYSAQMALLFRLGHMLGSDRLRLQGLKKANKAMMMVLEAAKSI